MNQKLMVNILLFVAFYKAREWGGTSTRKSELTNPRQCTTFNPTLIRKSVNSGVEVFVINDFLNSLDAIIESHLSLYKTPPML